MVRILLKVIGSSNRTNKVDLISNAFLIFSDQTYVTVSERRIYYCIETQQMDG